MRSLAHERGQVEDSDAWMPSVDRLKGVLAACRQRASNSTPTLRQPLCSPSSDLSDSRSLRETVHDPATYTINFRSQETMLGSSTLMCETTRRQNEARQLPAKKGPFARTKTEPVNASETQTESEIAGIVDPAEKVRTGDDVVEFYARYGQDSPVKFFYCNRDARSLTYLPYDLVVVPKEKLSKDEYFTVSATGIMQIEKGVRAEFTPLSDWVHEKIMFRLLKKLKFYKFFYEAGCFFRWRKASKQIRFKKLRKEVAQRLFQGMESFAKPLAEIHAVMYGIETLSFCSIDCGRTYQLAEFKELQRETRDKVTKPKLGEIADAAQEAVEELCARIEKSAQSYRDSIRDPSELLDRTGVELLRGRKGSKQRSMQEIKQEKIDRANSYRRAMREERLLGRFVRLVDAVFVGKLWSRCLDSLRFLLSKLDVSKAPSATSRASKGVFQTGIAFNQGGIHFSPDCGDLLAAIEEDVFDGLRSTLHLVPRLVLSRSFSRFFPEKPLPLDVLDVLQTSHSFQTTKSKILKAASDDFSKASQYAKSFEEYRRIHAFGETWNPTEFAATRGVTLREIRKAMHKQKEWRNDLEKMKLSQAIPRLHSPPSPISCLQVVGCLYVETKTLRSRLIPVTEQVMEDLKDALLDLAQGSSNQLLQNLRQRIESLRLRPFCLDEFAQYQLIHEKELDAKKHLMKQAADIDDMYDLLAVHRRKIPTSDQVRYDDLKESTSCFIEELKFGKEFIADQREMQIVNLQNEIQQIHDKIADVHKSLQSGIYMNVESDPEEVIRHVHDSQHRLSEIRNRIEVLRAHQSQFGTPTDDFHSLELTEKVAKAKLDVWTTCLKFAWRRWSWLNESLVNQTTGNIRHRLVDVQAEVTEFLNVSSKLSRENKDDRVVLRLRDRIEQFKSLDSVLELVLNPALKQRHWESIVSLLGGPESAQVSLSSLTVQQLLDLRIQERLSAIREIVVAATEEATLRSNLTNLQQELATLSFNLISLEDSGTYVLKQTETLQAKFAEGRARVQEMLCSSYVSFIEEESALLLKQLDAFQSLLDRWMQCQHLWLSLCSAPSIEEVSTVATEQESFSKADILWRELMEVAIVDSSCSTLAGSEDFLIKMNTCCLALQESQKDTTGHSVDHPKDEMPHSENR